MGIKIKGKSGGVLEIEIQPLLSFVDIKNEIIDKLSKNKGFFMGAEAKIVFSGKDAEQGAKAGHKAVAANGL